MLQRKLKVGVRPGRASHGPHGGPRDRRAQRGLEGAGRPDDPGGMAGEPSSRL